MAVVVAARQQGGEEVRVIVAPRLHTSRIGSCLGHRGPPSEVKRLPGLDAARQWLRYEELNRFTWPGFDMRPVPGRAG